MTLWGRAVGVVGRCTVRGGGGGGGPPDQTHCVLEDVDVLLEISVKLDDSNSPLSLSLSLLDGPCWNASFRRVSDVWKR